MTTYSILAVVALAGAGFTAFRYFLAKYMANNVLAKITDVESEQKAQKYNEQVAEITQEIKNAKIAYDTARRNTDSKPRPGDNN